MKTNFLRKTASIKAGAHVSRFLGKLGMTVLLMLCVPAAVLSAQTGNGVTVSGLTVGAGTVTFGVNWKQSEMPEGNNKVWVFVDHNNNGVMTRLRVSDATVSAGTVTKLDDNDKGVWVGNSLSAAEFSATVTLSFTSPSTISGACAYASNYPPVGEYATASSITFTGTPPFDLVLSPGGNVSVEEGYELSGSQTLASFSDKTGAPGIIKCVPPATYNLIASASGFCASEAGITFSLDGTQLNVKYQLYRGSDKVGSELTGTGSGAATFTGGPFKVAGTYTAQSVAESGYCAMLMSGSHTITANATPTAPTISVSPVTGAVCENAGALVFTATGYTGALEWTEPGGGDESANSVTFVSGTSPDTKTVKARSSQTYTNAQTCHSAEVTRTGTINALPDNPFVEAGERCGAGTVTLSASSSGAVIDWYDIASGGTSLTTDPSITLTISVNATYYAEARFEATGCVSDRVPVMAAIDVCCTAPNKTVNFTAFNPCGTATIGSFWYLTDTREADNTQTYKVKKMADGHIWMVQDMKFGNKCKNNSFNSTSSNTTGKVTSLSGTWYGNCTAATNTNTPAARGYLYDWAAAINKADAYSGSSSDVGCSGTVTGTSGTAPGACQGICPVGWHIPTGYADGEFRALHNMSVGCNKANADCWDADSSWEGVIGGHCEHNGSLSFQGVYAYYWSSTPYDSEIAYNLHFSADLIIDGTYFCGRFYGFSVRCVRNFD
jgi:uncharacterized protein (TIGR02145 family)